MHAAAFKSFVSFCLLALASSVLSFLPSGATSVTRESEAAPPLPVPEGEPLAKVDLMTAAGVAAFQAQWRYSDARIVPATNPAPGADGRGSGAPVETYDIEPKAGAKDYEDSAWPVIAPESLADRRGAGKICFNWYRITLTLPEDIGGASTKGMTAVLHCTVDDYAEVWVNGELPLTLRGPSPNLVQGFNIPNRVTIAQDVTPGEKIELAIFGMNGPISAAPSNYIFFRDARIEFHAPDAKSDGDPAGPQN